MKDIAIIGGGLAGTACAYVLKAYGFNPVIYEAELSLAAGASGNDIGLYNPRLSAECTPESEYYSAAFALALRTFPTLDNIDWNPCGALHLINTEKKAVRFPKTLKNWQWPEENLHIVNTDEASNIAGTELKHDALFLPQSGYVSPKKLCEAYAQNIDVHLNHKIKSIQDIDADGIVLTSAMDTLLFKETQHFPLQAVRGQITHIKTIKPLDKLKTNLCYGGYCTPPINDTHLIGATFQRWLNHSEIIKQDDLDNLKMLTSNISECEHTNAHIINHRASVRTASKDHFPIVGKVPNKKRLYVSTAHGSHGILSTLMGAHVLADMIAGAPQCLPSQTIEKLSIERF